MHARSNRPAALATAHSPAICVAPSALDAAIEAICQKGCRQVNQDIARLERGETLPEQRALTAAEGARLLDELRAIMAVYRERRAADQ
jgi:hypothetical protein